MLKYRLAISASLLLALGARSSSAWAMQEELDGEKPPIAAKNSERQRLRAVVQDTNLPPDTRIQAAKELPKTDMFRSILSHSLSQDDSINLRDRIRAAELLPRDNPERSKILLKLWRQ